MTWRRWRSVGWWAWVLSSRESWADGDESLTGPESDADTPSSRRSRSTRRGRSSSAPAPTQRPKRSRPSSLTSRGAINRRKAEANKKSGRSTTTGLPEQDSERDPTARSSNDPELPVASNNGSDESDVDSTVYYREFSTISRTSRMRGKVTMKDTTSTRSSMKFRTIPLLASQPLFGPT